MPAVHPGVLAYVTMAEQAHYRPCAPSDGFGNITTPVKDLDLFKEAADYTVDWLKEDEVQTFRIGCSDYSDITAQIYTVEAARAICAVNRTLAIKLLQLAIDDLKQRPGDPFRDALG